MKTTWSEQGLDGGRMVHRIKQDTAFRPSDPSAQSDSIYIVSYGRGEDGNEYWLTSLADGMQLYKSATLATLAEKMNEGGNFHPMSGADKDKVIAAATQAALRMR